LYPSKCFLQVFHEISNNKQNEHLNASNTKVIILVSLLVILIT
jgi:hypothetical protein